MFSIRKLKGKNRSFVILKGQSYKILIEKINENIRKKIYSFSSLFNIYYDLSFLRSSVDVLLDRLSEEVTSNKSLITLPIILQLLQAASQKSNNIGLIFKEYVLINRLFIQLEEKYKDLKIDQKCHLFKYIAKLEMRYHPMKYEFPEFYLRLKTDIHQNLEKVNESLLMSIINAYTHLPINFPNDLLNEIKNVFIVTLQENGKNINSGFLLDFLENFQQIMNHKKKSSFKVEHFQTIVSFIIERIKSKEEIMISTKSLNSLIKIFENDEKLLKDLIDPIYDCCIQSLENKKSIFAATTLEIFLKYKKDIKPFLLQVYLIFLIFIPNIFFFLFQISEILTKDKLNEFFAIRIYHLLTQITLTPTLETYLEECKDMAFKLLEKEPSKFVWSLKTSRINSEIKEQLLIQVFFDFLIFLIFH